MDVTGIAGNPVVGTLYDVTVTAKQADNSTATGYIGTVHFATNDADTRAITYRLCF